MPPPTTPAPTEVELRQIAQARLEDALVLLGGGRWDRAAYLCGYVVEMLLKARVCDRLGWSEYPAATLKGKFVDAFRTHNLDELLFWSGREAHVLGGPAVTDWMIVRQWDPIRRYRDPSKTTEVDARLAAGGRRSVSSEGVVMNPENWRKVVDRIEREKGKLDFFALLLPDDSPGKWDVVVSSPALSSDQRATFEYLAHTLRQVLPGEEWREISRVIPIPADELVDEPAVREVPVSRQGNVPWVEARRVRRFKSAILEDAYYFVNDLATAAAA